MSALVEYPLTEEASILIEVKDDDKVPGLVRSSVSGKAVEKAQQEFGKAIQSVNTIAKTVLDNLSDLEAQHVAVEFGVKLNGGLDAIVASISAEANFQVTLTWDKLQRQ